MKTIVCLCVCMLSMIVYAQNYSDTLVIQGSGGNFLYTVNTASLRPVSDLPAKSLGYFHETESPAKHRISFSFQDGVYQGIKFRWWQYTVRDSTENTVYTMSWDSKPKESGYILYPLSWSSDSQTLYLYSQNGDMYDNEQGIFSLDLQTGVIEKIIDESLYLSPPIINSSRTAFFFINHASQVCRYDIGRKMSEVLIRDRVAYEISWALSESTSSNSLVSCDIDTNQPDMVAPFTSETPFCVTRMGFDNQLFCDEACAYNPNLCSPAPFCEGHCQTGCVNCRNAVDVDITVSNPTFVQRRVRATAAGFVIRVMNVCPVSGLGQGYGFGFHVVVRHGSMDDENAPETLYAHLSSVAVQEGQYVFAYQTLGQLGNTQVLDCDGDGVLDCDCGSDEGEHLHYEYHNGSAALYGTSDIDMPVFSNTGGCVLQPNNSYIASGLSAQYLLPSANVEMSYECTNNGAIVTLTGTSCGCCNSYWNFDGIQIPGDTLSFPLTSAIFELPDYNPVTQVFWMGRISQSPCASQTSAADVPVYVSVVLENCWYGCTNPTAVNYDASAIVDDGSCEFEATDSSLCGLMDLNSDGIVNIFDISLLLNNFGSDVGEGVVGDVNQDGIVNVIDFFTLMTYLGDVCD